MKHSLKLVLFLAWATIFGTAGFVLLKHGITLSDLHVAIKNLIDDVGVWGPAIYIMIYSFRSLVFFPASVLTAIGGLLFGPLIGILSTMIGENISANISFVVGRYFGIGILKDLGTNRRWLPLMECRIKDNGFLYVLTMRLVYLPFDLVGYGSGACGITQRDFALATAIGTIPGLVTFVYIGSAFTEPKYLALVILLLIVGWALSKYFRTKTSPLNLKPVNS
jgi:uncharacterized membrane protein YdjX (TVP38/TMEM64 family)